jgi:lysine 2,3-aminomutase
LVQIAEKWRLDAVCAGNSLLFRYTGDMGSDGTAATIGSPPVLEPIEETPGAQKPAVDPDSLVHKQLREGEFWRSLPGYADVDTSTFLDDGWQAKNSVTRLDKLSAVVQGLVTEEFLEDVQEGLRRAPMSVRISPYIVSLIDWSRPYRDPLRRQFLPVGSALLPDHPRLDLDSLCEQSDSPVRGLTHRYPDKALFLVLDTCPVYCRFCTRSYAVGRDTEQVEKFNVRARPARWERVFEYLRSRVEVEDVVISGGDVFQLRADQLQMLGDALLDLPNIRRMRFASKGPAVMPMKLLSDDAWFRALVDVVERGRGMHKEVVLHTHFNHPEEITDITRRAMNRLFEEGVTVRNQTVLLRGVNDDADDMRLLIKRMGHLNVHAYYVYQHDMVKGLEDLRTTVSTTVELEKSVRGATAGYNTPTFVVDAPGGGGKRQVHSFEHYDPTTGISVYRSPNVDPNAYYLYFDPIDCLPPRGQRRWTEPREHEAMVSEALEAASRSSA